MSRIVRLSKYKQGLFKRGLMKTTVRNQLMLLSAFFDYAVKTKVLSSNPVSEIATIKQSSDPDPDHLTEEEVD